MFDAEKKPLGVMSLNDAIKLAQQQGSDLVEITATAVLPVCRIVDFGKFRYEQAKNEKHVQKAGLVILIPGLWRSTPASIGQTIA